MDIGLKRNLRILSLLMMALAVAGCLRAQDITGNWQGTITSPQGRPLRIILQVTHDDGGVLKARIYSIDQDATGDWADFITLHDSTVKFAVGMIQLSYEGKVSADGKTITGTWTQGSRTPFTFQKATEAIAWALPTDPTPHTVQLVTVEPGVKLEVLNWGGSGSALIFLAGLGDDVLAVMSALRLQKPALVGHSIAGEELSSIGSRHPERVSGLIYLECSGSHSFYDRAHGDLQLDMIDVRNKIEQLLPDGGDPSSSIRSTEALLDSLPQLEKELQNQVKLQQAVAPPTAHPSLPQRSHPTIASAVAAIISGEQKYTEIKVPCLAFFAVPHDLSRAFPGDAARHAAVAAGDLERQTRLANSFQAGIPSAKIIRLPNASHYIFRSNEAEVLRAMNDFLSKLPQR